MNDLKKRIDDFEAKAAENELIGRLAADLEVRTYNKNLASKLREHAAMLCCGLLIGPQNGRANPRVVLHREIEGLERATSFCSNLFDMGNRALR